MNRLRSFVVGTAMVAAIASPAIAATDGFRPVDVFDETLREAWPPGTSPSGSGFAVGSGHVVTAAHVIAGCRVMWVRSNSLRQTSAKILGLDTRADVALLAVPGLPDRWRTTPAAARPGDPLVLRGFPQRRGKVAGSPSDTAATYAAEVEDVLGGPVLEMAGRGPEGLSGGPVTNAAGHVVGMVVARRHGAVDRILAIPAGRLYAFLAYMGVDWGVGDAVAGPPAVGRTTAAEIPGPVPRPTAGPAPIEPLQVGCSR